MDCSLPGSSLSMGFPRQEYWSGLPFPSPGALPDPEIEPGSPALQADTLPSESPGKPLETPSELLDCNRTPRALRVTALPLRYQCIVIQIYTSTLTLQVSLCLGQRVIFFFKSLKSAFLILHFFPAILDSSCNSWWFCEKFFILSSFSRMLLSIRERASCSAPLSLTSLSSLQLPPYLEARSSCLSSSVSIVPLDGW